MITGQPNPRRVFRRHILAGAGPAALLAGGADAETATRGAIIGTLGGEPVRWFVLPQGSNLRLLGADEAQPGFHGAAYRVPEGIGAISFTLDLSGRAEDFILLEIHPASDIRVLWRADRDSDVSLRATYRLLPQNMASVMGDLHVTLDSVDAVGEVLERGAGPELVISFTAQLVQRDN